MQIVITSRTFFEAGKGNVEISNIIKNQKAFGLEIFAPELFPSDVDRLRKEQSQKEQGLPRKFDKKVSDLMKYIKIVLRGSYITKISEAERLTPEGEKLEYIALALTLPAPVIWDDDPHYFEKVEKIAVMTTYALYQKTKKVFQIFQIGGTQFQPLIKLSENINSNFVDKLSDLTETWLLGPSEEDPNTINIDILPNLSKVDDIEFYEVDRYYSFPAHGKEGIYQYAEIRRSTLNSYCLKALKEGAANNFENGQEGGEKKLKIEQYKEILIAFGMGDTEYLNIAREPEIYETGYNPNAPVNPPIKKDFPQSQNRNLAGEIFIPQEILLYDKKKFQEEYLQENLEHKHPFDALEKDDHKTSDIIEMECIMRLLEKKGNESSTIMKMKIGNLITQINTAFNNQIPY